MELVKNTLESNPAGDSYKLGEVTLMCPKCQQIFATACVDEIPVLNPLARIEADLHRVLPDAAIRAAMIATCPNCTYTWWTESFIPNDTVPLLAIDAPAIDPVKKFGHAILSSRMYGATNLEKAQIALNAYYCARDSFQSGEKILQIAKEELRNTIDTEAYLKNKGRHLYIMAEIYRLSGEFHEAVKFFYLVDRSALLPQELLDHQIRQAKLGNAKPVTIPNHIVKQIYDLRISTDRAARFLFMSAVA